MPSAAVTSKGQITIPKEVRIRLGIATGDRLDFQVLSDGTLTARRLKPGSLDEVFGVLYRPGQRPVSVEDMNDGIAAFHGQAGKPPQASRSRRTK